MRPMPSGKSHCGPGAIGVSSKQSMACGEKKLGRSRPRGAVRASRGVAHSDGANFLPRQTLRFKLVRAQRLSTSSSARPVQ